MLRFSLGTLLALVTIAGLACAALMSPNIYFAALFQFATIVATLSSCYVVIVQRGMAQRLALGFAVFVIGLQIWLAFFDDSIKIPDRIGIAIAASQGHTLQFSGGFFGESRYPPASNNYFEPTFANTNGSNISAQRASTYEPLDYGSLRTVIESLLTFAMGLIGMLVAMIVHGRDREVELADG